MQELKSEYEYVLELLNADEMDDGIRLRVTTKKNGVVIETNDLNLRYSEKITLNQTFRVTLED